MKMGMIEKEMIYEQSLKALAGGEGEIKNKYQKNELDDLKVMNNMIAW